MCSIPCNFKSVTISNLKIQCLGVFHFRISFLFNLVNQLILYEKQSEENKHKLNLTELEQKNINTFFFKMLDLSIMHYIYLSNKTKTMLHIITTCQTSKQCDFSAQVELIY